MKKSTLSIILLIISLTISAQNLLTSRQTSYYTYVYKITNEEAGKIYKKGAKTDLYPFLHSLIDSVETDSLIFDKDFQTGHYLIVYAANSGIHFDLKSINNVDIRVLNNKMDLSVTVYDTLGSSIENAIVKVSGKRVSFDKMTETYRLANTAKKGITSVEYEGHISYFEIDKQVRFSKLNRFVNRKIISIPIALVVRPVNYVVGIPATFLRAVINFYRTWGWQRFYYHTTRPIRFVVNRFKHNYEGYIVLNQPVYRAGDTVRYKMYIVNENGKPRKKTVKLNIRGTWNTRYNSRKVAKLEPHSNGTYSGELVLSDSLNLPLDSRFNLFVSNERVDIKTSFRYEDYELQALNCFLRKGGENHIKGKPFYIYARCTDEIGLSVPDARIEITITNTGIQKVYSNNILVYADNVFVPDTLWKTKKRMDLAGETKIQIPDSIFPNATLDYKITANFFDSSNEKIQRTEVARYNFESKRIVCNVKGDSIHIHFEENGDIVEKQAKITSHIGNKNKKIQTISTPSSIKISPLAKSYKVVIDSTIRYIGSHNYSLQLGCTYMRKNDSVSVRTINPQNIEFSYYIYYKNRELRRGKTTKLSFTQKDIGKSSYFVVLQYVWTGVSSFQEYEIERDVNTINIEVDVPEMIYPGQKTTLTVSASDYNGKPVINTDLTAFANTKKFDHKYEIDIDYPEYENKYQKQYNNIFTIDKNRQTDFYKTLKWDFWNINMRLDTIEQFRFLFPKSGYYQSNIDVESQITQIAPFVVDNGKLEHIRSIHFDGIPVFYDISNAKQAYSFRAAQGYHTLKIRTRKHEIRIDSVYCEKDKKTILCVDAANVKRKNIEIKEVKWKYTNEELRQLKKHLLILKTPNSGNYSYVKQKDRIFYYNTDNHRYNSYSEKRIAPLLYDNTWYCEIDSFENKFLFEAGYKYEINPALIKQRCYTVPEYMLQQSNFRFFTERLYDEFLTPKDIETLWKQEKEQKQSKAEFINTLDTDAKIELRFKEKIPVKNIVCTYQDTDTYDIFKGTQRILKVKSGLCKLTIVLFDGKYFEIDSVNIAQYGTTILSIKKPENLRRIDYNPVIFNAIESNLKHVGRSNNYYYNSYTDLLRNYPATEYSKIITGTIYCSDDGSPLPGVSVTVIGTANTYGTITNFDGNYQITVPPATRGLSFAFVGMVAQNIPLGNQSEINVTLEPSLLGIDEVVVTALSGKMFGTSVSYRTFGFGDRNNRNNDLLNNNQLEMLYDEDNFNSGATDKFIIRGASTLFSDEPNNKINELSIAFLSGASQAKSLRTNFRDYAYWQPNLMTDENGKASFEVTFPDDVTTWNNYFIAMNGNKQSGMLKTEIKAFKPVMARLATPRFFVEGDTAFVIGKTLNYTQDSIQGKISYFVDNELKSEKDENLHISVIDTLPLYVSQTDTLTLKYTFGGNTGQTAQSGQTGSNFNDGEERKIPVFRTGTLETKGQFIALNGDTSITIVPQLNAEKLKIYAETDIVKVLLDEIDHINGYPYGCNEQKASKLKALLLKKKVVEFTGEKFKHNISIRKLINGLEKAQSKNEGLWGWWTDTKYSVWISVHVAEALLMAEKQGYNTKLNKYQLKSKLIYIYETLDRRNKIGVLKLLKQLNSDIHFESKITEIEKSDSISFISYLELQELKQNCGLQANTDTLTQSRKTTLMGNYYWGTESYIFGDNAMITNLLAYKILRHAKAPETELQKIRNYFLERRNTGHWRNTYEAALVLETILPDILKGKTEISPSKLQIGEPVNKTITEFPYFAEVNNTSNLQFAKTGDFPLYLAVYQQEWNKTPTKVDSLFEVSTTWNGSTESRITLQSGKPLKVRVTVVVKKAADYVMIEVPIPASCSYESKKQDYWGVETHREYFKDKTSVFCEHLSTGTYTFDIELLSRFNGIYTINPAKAEQMYFPIFFGREEGKKVVVE